MLQIEHIYQFLYKEIFNHARVMSYYDGGVPSLDGHHAFYKETGVPVGDDPNDLYYFCNDQEPILESRLKPLVENMEPRLHEATVLTSERSEYTQWFDRSIYYFFHGFAALDWFRGYRLLNHDRETVKDYKYDYQSFNRIITGDRAYRKTFVDQLRANDLLKHGAVSYGVTDDPVTEERLVIDHEQLPGSASASIPEVDAYWHVVTETVFHEQRLHLTEKIFKPIVSKQPFMLLAAPCNLEYLRSYGFETFTGIIDESYDFMTDDRARIDAVVKQLKWYCDLNDSDKRVLQQDMAPILEHNFNHFYGKFLEIIVDELLENVRKHFKEINRSDSHVNYESIRRLLTNS